MANWQSIPKIHFMQLSISFKHTSTDRQFHWILSKSSREEKNDRKRDRGKTLPKGRRFDRKRKNLIEREKNPIEREKNLNEREKNQPNPKKTSWNKRHIETEKKHKTKSKNSNNGENFKQIPKKEYTKCKRKIFFPYSLFHSVWWLWLVIHNNSVFPLITWSAIAINRTIYWFCEMHLTIIDSCFCLIFIANYLVISAKESPESIASFRVAETVFPVSFVVVLFLPYHNCL